MYLATKKGETTLAHVTEEMITVSLLLGDRTTPLDTDAADDHASWLEK